MKSLVSISQRRRGQLTARRGFCLSYCQQSVYRSTDRNTCKGSGKDVQPFRYIYVMCSNLHVKELQDIRKLLSLLTFLCCQQKYRVYSQKRPSHINFGSKRFVGYKTLHVLKYKKIHLLLYSHAILLRHRHYSPNPEFLATFLYISVYLSSNGANFGIYKCVYIIIIYIIVYFEHKCDAGLPLLFRPRGGFRLFPQSSLAERCPSNWTR